MPVVLGVDTSNYTTSAALVSLNGQIISDVRKLLPVKMGEVGLRQSEALFLHIRQWPDVLAQLQAPDQIVAVAYSATPRPVEGSYMPVFLAGESFAQTISKVLNVPLFPFSHQEGHMRAALAGVDLPPAAPFIAIHISGGTTDILHVQPKGQGCGYSIDILGQSVDLHAGQFIDRVGVAMGLSFPCGRALDSLAESHSFAPVEIPSAVDGLNISFAGPATAAQRALAGGAEHFALAQGVFRCISNSLEKVLTNLPEGLPKTVLLCGGVAANTHIRTRLTQRLRRFRFVLSSISLSSDNAVGVALLGRDALHQR